MGSRERRKHERAAVGLAFVHLHTADPFVHLGDGGQVGEVELGVNPLRIHIQSEGDDIDVARALPVAEEGALDPFAPCEQAHFAVRHRTTSVVMGVEGKHDVFPVFQVLAHILDLVGVHVGHGMGDGDGQVDDDLILRRGLPNIEHGVADFRRELGLGTRETLGGILEGDFALGFLLIRLTELRACDGDVDNFLLGTAEHLFTLRHGRGIIQVHDRVFGAVERLEGLGDDMLARLGEHLNGDVVGNEVLLDEGTAELVFRLACGGEPDLDFLEPNFTQELEKFKFFLQAHRNHECLIAVAKIHATPNGRFVDARLFRPVHRHVRRIEILFFIFLTVFHTISYLPYQAPLPEVQKLSFCRGSGRAALTRCGAELHRDKVT